MRLDFDFQHHAGYAIARRNVDLDLPANYEITFRLRAEAPVNNLELKLIDSTGDNVWWLNRRDFSFPPNWQEISTRKRQIQFAWGPLGGGEIHHVAAIEIVVTASTGGKGTVWIDDLALNELPPPTGGPVTHGPWRGSEGRQSLTIDLGALREVGGLHIRWDADDCARDFSVDLSRDGTTFKTVREVAGNSRRDELLFLPDEEARLVRLSLKKSHRGTGYAIESVDVQPPEWAQTPNEFFALVAQSAARGDYPRYLVGEQPYWTVLGADGAEEEALIGEDGTVEPYKAGFSIEPFLKVGDKIITWSDAAPRQSLAEGDLPIPTVTWTAGDITLDLTAAVTDSSMLLLRYRLRGPEKASLALAIRPFQVNPSTQFLNTQGGVAPIHSIAFNGEDVIVNGTQRVHAFTRPASFIAATYDEGSIVDLLRHGVSSTPERKDPFGYASGTLIYAQEKTVDLAIPLENGAKPVTEVTAAFQRITADWREKLHRVDITIPGAPEIADTIRANIAWTLIHRDGPALQPGSRSYDRAWIRDGALIASLLLRLGHADIAKRFAEWFAAYQYPDGKVPCCVDRRGADPVPENDSHGELIFLVAEIERLTHDEALVRRLWPHIDKAARYMAELSSQNHGLFEGLLTESISHEGYSAKPQHSYWDDLFALRGLDDAAYLAGRLRLLDRQRELAAQAATFQRSLETSIRRSIAEHHIDFVPGSAELGDFDATSTAIGISPLNLTAVFPPAELTRTFDRYFESIAKPREDYTPYEMRIIGALIRRGDKQRALSLIDRFLADRRPAAWNEWAEVVGTDARKPRFIGDMPHAWIASDFIRSILDAIAYDREDGALVVGAGVPRRWLGTGTLHIGPLPTYSGSLDLRMHAEGDRDDRIVVELSGDAHPARLLLRSPDDRPIRSASIDGKAAELTEHEIVVPRLPARVVFEY
ncbi:MAG TPA: discoidin domain-containing protein [Thermoanaerobaculia bacterium]|nr:discoidin domain-containing protein [Thermoanaerobaculia bacterium]